MLLFLVVNLVVIPYLVDTSLTPNSKSRGSPHLQIRRMGLVVYRPCPRLWGVHRGHQDQVPWGRIVLQVGLADRSRLSALGQRT